ncbi:unnamed protein product [Kluyveromyces dobzhanskii CBS 2104]|uniref:DNA topoisomerase (ATP-hydrolyzing) n=1 Tax=Kluyveromyces dobzhanskii CBS 2104 TaxID=1427455 RepID=A0A0A8L710_9SACH|nr:unnamed protein product [Kluyveromyces dobzhanskii CBS 2104]
MSLRMIMGDCSSRVKLKERLTPESRVVEFSEVKSEEECQRQITNNMRFIRLALKEHRIPITILFNGKAKKHTGRTQKERMIGGNMVRWRYPEFGTNKKKCSRVPQLLHLLQIINERIKTRKNTTTVRDVYYGNVELFESQRVTETLLHRIENMFNVQKQFFNIVSTQKGLIYSGPQLLIDSQEIRNECQLIPYMTKDTSIRLPDLLPETKLKVIVLEKDAIFQQLIQCHDLIKNWIIITGKGYPDLLSRILLHKMDKFLPQNVEFHIFTDTDPYGIDIVTKYMCHPTLQAARCPRLIHKGVLLNQLIRGNSTERHSMLVLLPLSVRDATFSMNLICRICDDSQNVNEKTRRSLKHELQRQLFFQRKGEMNVANNGDVEQYFERMYDEVV